MSESFLTKEVGTLGDGAGEVTELRILNRVVRWSHEGLTYEADPRHVDILRQGIAGAARSLSSPGTLSRDLNPEEDEALPEAAAGLYRSFAARANYLALDRPDLAFAAKELCRRMRSPGKADLEALRRLGRYLLDSPRGGPSATSWSCTLTPTSPAPGRRAAARLAGARSGAAGWSSIGPRRRRPSR